MAKLKIRLNIKLSEGIFAFLLVLSGVFLSLSSGGFVLNFKNIGFSIFSAAEMQVHNISSGAQNTFNAVKELADLKEEYNKLLVKLEKYEMMQRSNTEIKKENERLKQQLDFSQSMEEKNYPAQIIARDLSNQNPLITINKGSSSGIKKNMPVVAFQNGNSGLVGKIVEVGKFTSMVMPIYNSNCSISSRLQNIRDLGLISGQGSVDKKLKMQYIRKRTLPDLHYGDLVVTSGENSNYMRDIVIGSISEIRIIEYNSSLDIDITPIIDFSRLENVVVVNMREINETKD
ncbi:MAG: rod shape-determining protein MreC [Treponema sp.]|nr:rod shape-determining protein MreC [Treponema sp.]